jgi:hypothetical protein
MIVCEQFVFVHVPKTGGAWVRGILKTHRHRDWYLQERRAHTPSSDAPEGRPVLGVVRNPWDWYVSYYFYCHRAFQSRSGPFPPSRRDAWTAALALPGAGDRAGFLRVLRLLVNGGLEGGPYARVHREMLPNDAELARFESLRDDVRAFLVRHDVPMNDGLRRALDDNKKVNVSHRGPYAEYYDAAARDLVATTDREILERYGYEFDAA